MAQPPRPSLDGPFRMLAIDPGERRTGVAVSDELGMFAHTRPAIHHRKVDELVRSVSKLVVEEGVSEVIVGLPLSLSGSPSAQTLAARQVAAALRSALAVPVSEWDERLSSVEAARNLHGESARKSGALDSAAAAVVLQAVLDSRRMAVRR